MLADDVEELMDVVGGMDRDRQLSGVRLAHNSAGVQVSTSRGTSRAQSTISSWNVGS